MMTHPAIGYSGYTKLTPGWRSVHFCAVHNALCRSGTCKIDNMSAIRIFLPNPERRPSRVRFPDTLGNVFPLPRSCTAHIRCAVKNDSRVLKMRLQ